MPEMTALQICQLVGGEVRGDSERLIQGIAPLDQAGPSDLAYAASTKHLPTLKTSAAACALVPADVADAAKDLPDTTLIVVDDAQRAFIKAMLEIRPPRPRATSGVSVAAHIAESAQIGPETNVGPGACIGEDVVIGARCDIGPGAVVGPGCRIGDETVIHANAVLYPDVTVGRRVILHATAVIGADGFGYLFSGDHYEKIPHVGTVVIEDDVEIGAGTTVDRAMIGATVIGAGTKLDNQVMIAHNCRIGRHNAYASQVGFAGSVTTGDYVQCGGQVGVANHATIGARSALGPKAGISGNVPEGERYQGFPARPEKEAVRAHLAVARLPDMRERLRELEKTVQQLRAELNTRALPSEEERAA